MFFYYKTTGKPATSGSSISIDATSTGFVASNTTVSVPHTCSGSNRGLMVFVSTPSARTITSVTYNGVGLTSINRSTGAETVSAYYLIAPATGTNNIVVNLDSTGMIIFGAVSLNGAHQTIQPNANNTQSTTTTSITTNVTTTVGNCWLFMGARAAGDGATDAGASTFERITNNGFLQVFDSNGTVGVGTFGLTTTQVSQPVSHSIIAIRPA